jgi:tRNA pseudouridine55 synthase
VTGYGRVGHGGTLDPFATGLLVLGLGPATRLMRFLISGSKSYEAEVRFGWETDSEDRTGAVVKEASRIPTAHQIAEAIPEFVGRIDQVPPRLSAIHVEGERSYRRARRGEEVLLAPREVEVHEIELLECEPPFARLRIECGGGTYVRSLARDLGRRLSSAAHLAALRRTQVGPFTIDQAVDLERFESGWECGEVALRPEALVSDWERLELDEERSRAVRNGIQPRREWWPDRDWTEPPTQVALLDPQGLLLGIAGATDAGGLELMLVIPEAG